MYYCLIGTIDTWTTTDMALCERPVNALHRVPLGLLAVYVCL